jgi:flagellum-specific peptidoglycan hydrolase FlgJ
MSMFLTSKGIQKNMKLPYKKIILPMAAVAVIGASILGANLASADSSTTDGPTSLVQKLSDTFHLDKSKVQAVFDQDRTEHQAEMEKNYEARLTQAVTDGQLTAAQKDVILTEHNKLKAEMDALKDDTSSSTDRSAAMDKIHTEAQAWAKDNNVDAKWLMGPGGPGRGFGHMGAMMHPDEN